MGRRKIEIKMVKDTNTRQVTFSKRRNGLFKKANELSILCGADVAIVVFSPGNKPYSFGHPSVDAVAAKYLTQGEEQDPTVDDEKPDYDDDVDTDADADDGGDGESEDSSRDDSGDGAEVERLNRMLDDVLGRVREAERYGAMCDRALQQRMALEGCDELQEMYDANVEFKDGVKARVADLETADVLITLAQKPVVGTSRKRRRIN